MYAQVFSQLHAEEPAFLAEQRRADMFVTVSTYKAKPAEEDAIIALHEAWQRHQQTQAKGYLSGELLRGINDSRQFITIMRFESQEFAHALTNDPEQKAWYQRLISLTESARGMDEYTHEWPLTSAR